MGRHLDWHCRVRPLRRLSAALRLLQGLSHSSETTQREAAAGRWHSARSSLPSARPAQCAHDRWPCRWQSSRRQPRARRRSDSPASLEVSSRSPTLDEPGPTPAPMRRLRAYPPPPCTPAQSHRPGAARRRHRSAVARLSWARRALLVQGWAAPPATPAAAWRSWCAPSRVPAAVRAPEAARGRPGRSDHTMARGRSCQARPRPQRMAPAARQPVRRGALLRPCRSARPPRTEQRRTRSRRCRRRRASHGPGRACTRHTGPPACPPWRRSAPARWRHRATPVRAAAPPCHYRAWVYVPHQAVHTRRRPRPAPSRRGGLRHRPQGSGQLASADLSSCCLAGSQRD